jgi:hypothetical protein
MTRKDFQEVQVQKSEKMMGKDFSGGGEAKIQNIRKNDKKRR